MTVLMRTVRDRGGMAGAVMLAFIVVVALIGPLLAPHAIDSVIGAPALAPGGGGAPLGTDFLGRDVLSRVLNGGLFVLGLSLTVTVISYLMGATIGLAAGYSRSAVDLILMRIVDLMISFPAILTLLLLVTRFGASIAVLITGVIAVMVPSIARLVRTTTLELSERGFVEAATALGDPAPVIVVRELLPNLAPVLLADFGVRFGYSIILIASMNYLGLGLTPPAADWGLLIAENRQLIPLNPWAVLVPAVLLTMLVLGVNLVADAYSRTLGRSMASSRR